MSVIHKPTERSPMAVIGRAFSDLAASILPRRFRFVIVIMDPEGAEGENSAMVANLPEEELPGLLHGIALQLDGGLRPVARDKVTRQ